VVWQDVPDTPVVPAALYGLPSTLARSIIGRRASARRDVSVVERLFADLPAKSA